jgi:hypothetical protein
MNNSIIMVFALIAALGLVAVVAVDFIILQQEAEAKGCKPFFTGFNASQTKCFKP